MVKVVNERSREFVITSRELVRDKKISFKARGLFNYMWDQADNWHFYINEIADHSDKDGVDSVRSGIKELTDRGYLKIIDVHDEKGHFAGKEWHLRDSLSKPWNFNSKKVALAQAKKKKEKTKKKETKQMPEKKEVATAPVKQDTMPAKEQPVKKAQPSELLKTMIKDHFNAMAHDLGRDDAILSEKMLIKIALSVEQKHLESRIVSIIDNSLLSADTYPAGYLLKVIENEDEVKV